MFAAVVILTVEMTTLKCVVKHLPALALSGLLAALSAFAVNISDRIQVSSADDGDVTLVFRHNIDAKFLDVLC